MVRQLDARGSGPSRGGGIEGSEVDDLAAQARGGDREALAALWEAVEPAVATMVRRTWRGTGGPLERADLEQQGFLVLVDLVRRWQGRGPFIAWLRRLFPLAMNRYRRAVLHWGGPRVESMEYAALAAEAEASKAETVADPFDAVLCRQLVAQLPVAYRRVIVWRFADGLAYREIERLHGVPAATAQARCERALAYLRAVVEGHPSAPLRAEAASRTRAAPGTAASVRALWALAAREGGLLPPAAQAAPATGLGRRAYDDLIARLEAAGCLTGANVSFASRRGRRRCTAVDCDEAVRRLGAAEPWGGARAVL